MAWTDPRTWASGELVTAAIMNSAVRDNLDAVQGAVLSKSAGYTIVAADFAGGVVTVKVDTTGGSDVTIVLPAASGLAGYRVNVVLADATFSAGKSTGIVIVDGHSSELINGLASTKLFLEFDHVSMTCDGTGWYITEERSTVVASYYPASDTSANDNTWTQIALDTVLIDSANACSSSNFTVPVGYAGIYQLNSVMRFHSTASGDTFHLSYYLNGSQGTGWASSYITWQEDAGRPSGFAQTQVLLDAGDVIALYGKPAIAAASVDMDEGPLLCCFNALLVKRTYA